MAQPYMKTKLSGWPLNEAYTELFHIGANYWNKSHLLASNLLGLKMYLPQANLGTTYDYDIIS